MTSLADRITAGDDTAEAESSDAPNWFDSEAAFAWACGWNAARDAFVARLRQVTVERDDNAELADKYRLERWHVMVERDAAVARAERAETDLIAARHSRDEFHRLWERERSRQDGAP